MEACCFTGHRHLPMGEEKDRLRDRCEAAVRHAYTLGCRRFFAGGALGFDMLAAAIVCRLRDTEYPDMSLHLLLPCKDQEAKWSERDKLRYAAMLSLADSHRYLYEKYADGVMAARNRALVASSDLCIAYLTNYQSGTGITYREARRCGLPVWNLASRA